MSDLKENKIDPARELAEEVAEWVDGIEADQAELNKAFAKAQGEMPNAVLNKVNPHFGSHYADIASIRDATVPALSKHGLSIRQFCRFKGDKLILVTKLSHESGQNEEGEYPIALDRPQAMGSSLTYGRRYNWSLMTGVAFEEDDDAEEAERDKPAQKTKAKARESKDYEALASLLDECTTKAELEAVIKTHRNRIEGMPDDWQKHLRDHYAHLLGGMTE